VLLLDFVQNVYRPLRLRGRSPETVRLYACTVRAFGRFLGHAPTLDDLADELTLSRFVDDRTSTRSPYTAEKERTQLVALARLANERRMIAALPACPPVVLPDRIATAWSADEMRRLYAAAASTPGTVAGVPAGLWWSSLVRCAWESGERIGALLEVRHEHYQRPDLAIPGELRKGRRRGRVYELTPGTCDQLDALLAAHQGPAVWPWPHAHTYVWDRLRTILRRAGLARRRVAFHQIRRSAISHLAAVEGEAAAVAFAGHASGATTRTWYIDPRYARRGPRPGDLLPPLTTGG
jgi:hypothetical protein